MNAEFDCGTDHTASFEEETDLKKRFIVSLPSHWKVNLFQNEIQSSIYAADTTVALSKSTLIDISYIEKEVVFDGSFKLQNEQMQLNNQLIKSKTKDFLQDELETHYTVYKGMKNNMAFTTLHTYLKKDTRGFIHMKADVYGTERVQERLCEAIGILDQLKF
ncbi:MAG: hypothetical protein CMB99_14815 [Flavobacteriaceae bacterium]|nr:hypothetical protein [Flavobacteriaceae bacterium]